MATAKPKTKKLVYSTTKLSVKQGDKHMIPGVGQVTVENIRAPRKKSGQGRVTVKHPDGTLHDYSPATINSGWI